PPGAGHARQLGVGAGDHPVIRLHAARAAEDRVLDELVDHALPARLLRGVALRAVEDADVPLKGPVQFQVHGDAEFVGHGAKSAGMIEIRRSLMCASSSIRCLGRRGLYDRTSDAYVTGNRLASRAARPSCRRLWAE